ncbi:MAG: hypothetical protein COB15_12080 [Flavobacteriales bacterium]|nr:MAG: hypothetical protein COB15_12080 [Flavobacteriales bacterium]
MSKQDSAVGVGKEQQLEGQESQQHPTPQAQVVEQVGQVEEPMEQHGEPVHGEGVENAKQHEGGQTGLLKSTIVPPSAGQQGEAGTDERRRVHSADGRHRHRTSPHTATHRLRVAQGQQQHHAKKTEEEAAAAKKAEEETAAAKKAEEAPTLADVLGAVNVGFDTTGSQIKDVKEDVKEVKVEVTGVKQEMVVVQGELATVKDTQVAQQKQHEELKLKQQQQYEELKQQQQQQQQQRASADGSLVSPSAPTDSGHTYANHDLNPGRSVSMAGGTNRSDVSTTLSADKAAMQARLKKHGKEVKVEMEMDKTIKDTCPFAHKLTHPSKKQTALHDDFDTRVQTELSASKTDPNRKHQLRRELKTTLDATPPVDGKENAIVNSVRPDEEKMFRLFQCRSGQVVVPAFCGALKHALENGYDAAEDYESLRLYALATCAKMHEECDLDFDPNSPISMHKDLKQLMDQFTEGKFFGILLAGSDRSGQLTKEIKLKDTELKKTHQKLKEVEESKESGEQRHQEELAKVEEKYKKEKDASAAAKKELATTKKKLVESENHAAALKIQSQ